MTPCTLTLVVLPPGDDTVGAKDCQLCEAEAGSRAEADADEQRGVLVRYGACQALGTEGLTACVCWACQLVPMDQQGGCAGSSSTWQPVHQRALLFLPILTKEDTRVGAHAETRVTGQVRCLAICAQQRLRTAMHAPMRLLDGHGCEECRHCASPPILVAPVQMPGAVTRLTGGSSLLCR